MECTLRSDSNATMRQPDRVRAVRGAGGAAAAQACERCAGCCSSRCCPWCVASQLGELLLQRHDGEGDGAMLGSRMRRERMCERGVNGEGGTARESTD